MNDTKELLINFVESNKVDCFQTEKMSESKTIGLSASSFAEARLLESQIRALGVPNVWIGESGVVFASLQARKSTGDINTMSL